MRVQCWPVRLAFAADIWPVYFPCWLFIDLTRPPFKELGWRVFFFCRSFRLDEPERWRARSLWSNDSWLVDSPCFSRPGSSCLWRSGSAFFSGSFSSSGIILIAGHAHGYCFGKNCGTECTCSMCPRTKGVVSPSATSLGARGFAPSRFGSFRLFLVGNGDLILSQLTL